MAPSPRRALGPAEELPTPPLDPRSLNALLAHHPERAVAIIAAMTPTQRCAQLTAQIILAALPFERFHAIKTVPGFEPCSDSLDSPLPKAPIEPAVFAGAEPDEMRRLIVALSPAQRRAQAIAQAAWLTRFGYPITTDEILAVFASEVGESAL